ncbi:MAG: hypothetical protein VYD54_12705 [Bdellovibrionota bacterium]|nr:hypothetical protein [Bdellovibrionota bacterium]
MENEKEDLKVLLPMCKDKIWNFFEINERTVKVDHQKEATNIICDILDDFLKYVGSASIFFKINFRIRETSLERVIESIKSLEAHFKNLFEYVFLVRKIQSIDEGKLKKVVQVAKLYPDFERSIDLIHQRARLINLLLKGIGESELALVYGKLASLVKLMPERNRLDESIIKNNLINPYKNILEKIEGIETELPKRVEEREVKIMDEKGYFIFLMGIIARFVMESEKGAHPKLPSLPKIEEIETKKLKTLLSEMRKGDVIFKEEKAILKLTYEIEDVLRRVFKDALVESNIYPFDKSNRNLIEFLKSYMFDQSLKKRKAS